MKNYLSKCDANRRPTTTVVTAVVIAAMLVSAPAASAATPATVSVSGTQWGTSTCYFGAVEGNSRFNPSELTSAGINAFRIYGGVPRWERSDDDGVYGWPSIAQIKADPSIINWSAWDAAMTSPPGGSDYSWSTTGSGVWRGNARTIFQALKDNNIRPIVTLRNQDNIRSTNWIANPISTTADQNEWWEHVFATVYWLNVRNDYRVDDWEIHNEPDGAGQGWGGSLADYRAFANLTADAIRYVYATYLPGRTPVIHAPATEPHSTWPQDVINTIPGAFDIMNFHNYDDNLSTYNQTVHGWLNAAGRGSTPLWLGEWGTYTSPYDGLPRSVNVLTNMIRQSRPGNEHVYGGTIFSMWDWVNTNPSETFFGLVDSTGDATWTYTAFKMGSRALNGCKPTYQATPSNSDLTSIVTAGGSGELYAVVTNEGSSAYTVDVNLSALANSGTPTLWRQDANHADDLDSAISFSSGHASIDIPAQSAFLLRITNPSGGGGGSVNPALTNPGFETDGGFTQTPTGWLEAGSDSNASYVESGGHTGSFQGTHYGSSPYNVYTYQQQTVPNGTYTIKAWIKSSGGQSSALLIAKTASGANFYSTPIPAASNWTQISLPNVVVSNGSLEVAFYSVASGLQWINYDDVEVIAQ